MSRIAVLLPVYFNDNPYYFRESLRSLISQSYLHLDIILLIDGDIDQELKSIIDEHRADFSKILKFKENHGLAYVLNRGLEYCFELEYEYIGRMDADDISLNQRFQKQISFLKENPEIDVVGGAITEIDENGKSRGKLVHYPSTHQECFQFFRKRDPLAHPAVLFRKSFFEKAGFYNENYRKNQDTQLWFKGFVNQCKFANINDVILKLRMTQDFFNSRRSGKKRASMIYHDRKKINKQLQYGYLSNVYAMAVYLITIAPPSIRRKVYRMFR